LLTGERVFDADTPLATVIAHVHEKPRPPSLRTELEIPDSLERVIMACLEKDPANRPASAAELNAVLAAVDLDEPWSAEQASTWWALHLSEIELDEAAGEPEPSPQLLRVDR
jgi:serine/threonine-protein kinase